jgi:hypothetical protein|tara:strand:- start:807 stop:908 length:102 start_codon:yes stop_codon:yes gene_type:complete
MIYILKNAKNNLFREDYFGSQKKWAIKGRLKRV